MFLKFNRRPRRPETRKGQERMEYKIRCIRNRKTRKARNRVEAGFVRIKVRGRKRWVKKAGKEAAKV